jgi:predicted SAM-dependent methyltransferase
MANHLNQFTYPYKLHLGCGDIKLDSWINIDATPQPHVTDLNCDLTQTLPFEDNSCQLIYHEHFLEHLPVEAGVSLLKECYRVLCEDGVMRIAMPSLDILIEKSYHGTWKEECTDLPFIQTRAELLNIAFRWWGHEWLYDREELHRRLHEAGFEHIKDASWRVSSTPELRGLESRPTSLLICEVRKGYMPVTSEQKSLQFQTIKSQLKQARSEVSHLKSTLSGMESSKFWKLRTAWIRIKEILKLSSKS